eukprot:gene9792-11499_t
MMLNFQDCYDSFADEVKYNGTSEEAFAADMTDLADLLNEKFAPTCEEESFDLISESSMLMADLANGTFPGNAVELGNKCQSIVAEAISARKVVKSRKSVASKTGFRKGMTIVQALGNSSGQQPNMSRRRPTSVIVAFPAFDKCDSLLYFPTTLIRFFNTTDMDAASKLMNKYFDKDCKVKVQGKNACEISTQSYQQVVTMGNEIGPDRIMCVHSTKVIENQILSSIYVKFTDIQPLYTILAQTSNILFNGEGVLSSGLYPDRVRRFQHFATELSRCEQVAQDLIAYSLREEDVLMYMRIDFTLTIDDMTRKILHFTHAYEITSVHIVGADATSGSI